MRPWLIRALLKEMPQYRDTLLVFCCISTGVLMFPSQRAAEIAHDGEGNLLDCQQFQQRPEIRMEDRIAAGAGLSTAAGFVYSGERFERTFGDFGRKDGFHDMYSGGFYPYSTQEAFPACCPIVISGDSAQVIQEVLS